MTDKIKQIMSLKYQIQNFSPLLKFHWFLIIVQILSGINIFHTNRINNFFF